MAIQIDRPAKDSIACHFGHGRAFAREDLLVDRCAAIDQNRVRWKSLSRSNLKMIARLNVRARDFLISIGGDS